MSERLCGSRAFFNYRNRVGLSFNGFTVSDRQTGIKSRQRKNQGKATVSIGTYAAVLHALGGMNRDFALIAKDDEFGRKLQDLNIQTRSRAKRGK